MANELDLALLKAATSNQVKKVVSLLSEGASPDARKNPAKKTVLMKAAVRGFSDIVKILLEHDVKINDTDMLNNTAFHYACISGDLQTVRLLCDAGAKNYAVNALNKTPLMSAIMHNRYEVVKYLLSEENQLRVGFLFGDDSELTLACQLIDLKIATYLLENFEPTNIKRNELQVALIRAVVQNRRDVITLLTQHGANVNYMDLYHDPPIFTAIRNHNDNIVDYLLELGVDVNKKCFGGETPVSFALSQNNTYAARALIKKGADIDEETLNNKLNSLRLDNEMRVQSIGKEMRAALCGRRKPEKPFRIVGEYTQYASSSSEDE